MTDDEAARLSLLMEQWSALADLIHTRIRLLERVTTCAIGLALLALVIAITK